MTGRFAKPAPAVVATSKYPPAGITTPVAGNVNALVAVEARVPAEEPYIILYPEIFCAVALRLCSST